MVKTEGKKFFLLASADESKKKRLRGWIQERMPEAVIYTASDYMEALIKIKNAPPQLLVTDYELGKGRVGQILDTIFSDEVPPLRNGHRFWARSSMHSSPRPSSTQFET